MSRTVEPSKFAQHVFLSEIEFQVQLAENAADRLFAASDPLDSSALWSAVHSILSAAGNVSKILWPSRDRYEKRGQVLRTLLAVDPASPLGSRKVRDHFEHYDERIDDWLSTPRSAVFVDQYIGPLTGTLGAGSENAHRAFDPYTGELRFRGESLNVAALLAALRDVQRECRAIRVL